MKFCVALAYNDARELPALARACDEAGFEGVILSDHLVYPAKLETRYPYTTDGLPRWEPDTAWPDPFVTAAALGAVTQRLRFIVSIFVLPLRHPALAAKSIATAAAFTNDRLVVGVGAGWMREEFALVGQPFERRGARMNEAIEVMRKLWTGEPVAHHGEFYDFEAVQMRPAPEKPVPIWGGGHAEPALRRAAQRCDGWLSEIQKFDEMPGILARLRELRDDSPRAGQPFSVCAAVGDAYTLDAYRKLTELGVSEIITVPWLFYGQPESLQDKLDGIARFRDEVMARIAEEGTP